MYLAINYSPPARQLVMDGRIEIDRFKTPDWEWMIEEAGALRPVAVHFNLEAGNANLDEVNWDRIDWLAKSTSTPYVNLHLDAKAKYHPEFVVDTTKKSEVRMIRKIIFSDVRRVVERFGAQNVIIENSPYRGEIGNTMRCCVDPKLISQVVEETGCGFLLDISHAVIASKYINMDTDEYLDKLPTDCLNELHFAGIHKIKGTLVDHLSIRKKNWKWLDRVLTRIMSGDWRAPWLLAFEYGGVGREFEWRCDPQVIHEQVPLLMERLKKI